MKNNISYYRHQTNSHNHWKFKRLRQEYGWEGEGRFWALNNIIADSENCKLDLSRKSKAIGVAMDLNMKPEEFISFLQFLIDDCELIKVDDLHCYYTDEVLEVFEEVMSKRKRDRTGRQERINKSSKIAHDNKKIANDFQQSKVDESKVDESSSYPTTASAVKELFLNSARLKKAWNNPTNYETGIDTFLIDSTWDSKKNNYRDTEDLLQHFLKWAKKSRENVCETFSNNSKMEHDKYANREKELLQNL